MKSQKERILDHVREHPGIPRSVISGLGRRPSWGLVTILELFEEGKLRMVVDGKRERFFIKKKGTGKEVDWKRRTGMVVEVAAREMDIRERIAIIWDLQEITVERVREIVEKKPGIKMHEIYEKFDVEREECYKSIFGIVHHRDNTFIGDGKGGWRLTEEALERQKSDPDSKYIDLSRAS